MHILKSCIQNNWNSEKYVRCSLWIVTIDFRSSYSIISTNTKVYIYTYTSTRPLNPQLKYENWLTVFWDIWLYDLNATVCNNYWVNHIICLYFGTDNEGLKSLPLYHILQRLTKIKYFLSFFQHNIVWVGK